MLGVLFLTVMFGSVRAELKTDGYMCDKLDRVIVIIDPGFSDSFVWTKMITSSGTKMYSIKTTGPNSESKASQIARDIKDCKKVKFTYDTTRRGADSEIVTRAEISLFHR